MYHISDIKRFMHCERYYFLSKDESNAFKPYLRSDEPIIDLLVKFLCKDESCFIGVKNDKTDRFINEKGNYDWFCHPRFEFNNLRINIPFLHKLNDKYDIYDIYFVYYGTQVKDVDYVTYNISLNVFRELGYEVDSIYLIYLNGDYVNDGTIDIDKLFLITDKIKDYTLKQYIEHKNVDYKLYLDLLDKKTIDDYPSKKCRYCKQYGICEFYEKCFPNEEKIEDDSILTLVSSKNKNYMYDCGIRHLKDVDLEKLEGNKVQYAQIMASKNGGVFVDKLALKNFLDSLSNRPISFIDFEWDRYLVPPYINMRPLDVLCFEYALYYIDENGNMEHRTFVGTGDCRKEFIEGLIEYLPKSGPILAYNAEGAEKLRLKELGDMFPEYKDFLDSVVDRFVDLATPFIEGIVYDVRMQGNYSLKKLVAICSDYSYDNLDIYDGMEAVFNWRDADRGSLSSEKIVNDLIEYCSLDAYGLFLVYKWLVELVVEP